VAVKSCSEMQGSDWNLQADVKPDGGLTVTTDRIQTVLLWEILQELKQLNRLLNCGNFLRIPGTLTRIKTNTESLRPKKTTKE
jgi:hypothetical protein